MKSSNVPIDWNGTSAIVLNTRGAGVNVVLIAVRLTWAQLMVVA